MTTCREELLAAAGDLTTRGGAVFTLDQIVREMARRGSTYPESTVRTHVTSIMCKDAPVNHANHFDDFERVGRGQYVLLKRGTVAPARPAAAIPSVIEPLAEVPAGNSQVQRDAETEVLALSCVHGCGV
jgi:hypothetical protein